MALYTPEEARAIIFRYNETLARGEPISEELAREYADAAIAMKGYSNSLQQKARELTSALQSLGKSANDGTQGLSRYNQATGATFDFLGTWAEKIPGYGKVVSFFVKGIGKYLTTVNQHADAQFKAYQDLSRSGLAVGMKDTFANLQSAGYTVSEISEFTKLAKDNATTFARMGSTGANGLKGFTEVSNSIMKSDLLNQFSNMGLTITDVNQGALQNIKFQQALGVSKIQTPKQLTESTRKYLEKQDKLTKITGLNAEQQNKTIENALKLEQFSAKQAELLEKAESGGLGAKEARAEYDRNEELMLMMAGAGASDLLDGVSLLLTTSVNDPRFQKISQGFNEFSNLVAAGEKDAGKLMNAAVRDAVKLESEGRGQARLGGFEEQFGSRKAVTALAANNLKDYTKAEVKAKAVQANQKTGKEDPNTADYAMMKNNMRDASQSSDLLVQKGIEPATEALKLISGLEQQVAGAAGEAAGKEGQLGGGTTLWDKTKSAAKTAVKSTADFFTLGLYSRATSLFSGDEKPAAGTIKPPETNKPPATTASSKPATLTDSKTIPLTKYDMGGYTGDSSSTNKYVASDKKPAVPSMNASELTARIFSNKAFVGNTKTDDSSDTDNVVSKINAQNYRKYLTSLSLKSSSNNNNAPNLGLNTLDDYSSKTTTLGVRNRKTILPAANSENIPEIDNDKPISKSTASSDKLDNDISVIDMLSSQAKKTLDAYGPLAQFGNFNKIFNESIFKNSVPPVSNTDTQFGQPKKSNIFDQIFDKLGNINGNTTNNDVTTNNLPPVSNTDTQFGQSKQTGNFDKTNNIPPSKNNSPLMSNFSNSLDSFKKISGVDAIGKFADSPLASFKEMVSTTANGIGTIGKSAVSTVTEQYDKFISIFPSLTSLFTNAGLSQNTYTDTNIDKINDQLSDNKVLETDSNKNLDMFNKKQMIITDVSNRLITKGITPTQKSFKILTDLLELKLESKSMASAGGTGGLSGMRSASSKRKSSINNAAEGGMAGSSAGGGGGAAGGAAGATAGGAAAGGGGAAGGAAGAAPGGAAGSTDTAGGNAANAMKLNAGGTGSVAGGTEETEKAGGLAAGTGPTTVGQNQQLFLQAMTDLGVTDPKVRAAMAASAEGESGFKMQSEIGYENTSNEGIRKSFGMGSVFGKMPDDELTKLKADPSKFFDYVYGGRYGNDQPGDGWKYRGRGFIGITFKGNYKQYGDRLGINLVGNPDLANDPKIAAKIGVMMMLDGMKKNSGADPYTQVARSIGNSNEVTEQRKKDAYARNMQTGEFGADKVADLSFMKRGAASTQTASATPVTPNNPTQTAQAEAPSSQVTSARAQGRLEAAASGATMKDGYKTQLDQNTQASIMLPDGKSIPADVEEEDKDDSTDLIKSLTADKIRLLAIISEGMTNHAELSRQLLQRQS
jgi:predicted chitinase